MKTISYKLKDLDQKEKKVTLKLGYVGENEHVQIRIDCSEIWENYPNAVASLAVEPPEGSKYPAIVTRDGDVVCWTVKDSDLVHDGDGRIQLTFTEGSEIQKTVICRTKVDESIVGSGTAPDPIADFVAEANEALAELEAAEVHGPVIGEDGYWYTWSKDAGEYVKTDTKAQGEDGQQGPAGKDGADGAPGQDGHTPVKGTDYWTQQDQADIVAAAALETVSAVIDDTAGDGDTNKTWSADKIAETTGQLLTAIEGVEEKLADTVINITPEWDLTLGISIYGTLGAVKNGSQVSTAIKVSKPIQVKAGDVVSLTGYLTSQCNIAWMTQDRINTYQGTPSFIPLSIGSSIGQRTETVTIERDGYIVVSAFHAYTCSVRIERTYKNQQEENARIAIDSQLRHNYVDTYDFVPNLEKKRINSILTYNADDKKESNFIVNAVAYPNGEIIACRAGSGQVVKIANDGTETVLLTIANAQDWRGVFMDSNLNVYVSPHFSSSL